MKILEIKPLVIPDIKVIRFARFLDHRGYFTEPYRKSDLLGGVESEFLRGVEFVQANESFSRKNVIRGLHFQWNPYMGKMVRTLLGRMVDIVLDIRVGSPTFGKAIAYDMPSSQNHDSTEWIWVPHGFAHGNFFPEETLIEYFCSGEYSPGCEAGISPLSQDIDWSFCDQELKALFDVIVDSNDLLISDKDRSAHSLEEWMAKVEAKNFLF